MIMNQDLLDVDYIAWIKVKFWCAYFYMNIFVCILFLQALKLINLEVGFTDQVDIRAILLLETDWACSKNRMDVYEVQS